ncbi:hypothetical protein T484DRAFT_1808983 [Baffinella frigidus]|nr:hypothetical protein T484DRAFT_1808983 [Cryptophyta sp. CCMP2293]
MRKRRCVACEDRAPDCFFVECGHQQLPPSEHDAHSEPPAGGARPAAGPAPGSGVVQGHAGGGGVGGGGFRVDLVCPVCLQAVREVIRVFGS